MPTLTLFFSRRCISRGILGANVFFIFLFLQIKKKIQFCRVERRPTSPDKF
jgi:hypothetical protein